MNWWRANPPPRGRPALGTTAQEREVLKAIKVLTIANPNPYPEPPPHPKEVHAPRLPTVTYRRYTRRCGAADLEN